MVEPEARKNGLDPGLIMRQIQQESKGNPQAVSPKGARGLMQLMPGTAVAYGVKDPFDPTENVRAGVAYMAKLAKQYKGDQRQMLLHYNGGPAAVQAFASGHAFKESREYLAGIQGGAHPDVVAQVAQQGPPPIPAGDTDQFLQSDTEQFLTSPEGEAPPLSSLGQPVTVGGPPPKPPDPRTLPGGRPHPVYDLATKAGIAVAEGMDPTTAQGRSNLAAGFGAAGTGAAIVGTGGMAAIPAALLTVTGAGLAGGAEQIGEQSVQAATGGGYNDAEVGRAAMEQAQNEALGQFLFGLPVGAAGRRLLASRVGRFAHESLSAAKQATLDRLGTALESAQNTLRTTRESAASTMGRVREGVSQATEGARQRVGEHVARMTGGAGEIVDRAKAGLQELEAGEFGPYQAMVNQPPPSPLAAGQATQAVMTGAAKTARGQIGERVGEVAKEGPPVNIADLKERARQIVEEQVRPSSEAFPHPQPTAVGEEAAGPATAVASVGHGQVSLADWARKAASEAKASGRKLSPEAEQLLAEAGQEQVKARLKHPIMGVVQRILSAEDEVPFYALHQFKRELDDALLGTADKVERKRVTNLTMHLRNGVRDALGTYEPYNQAAAAYEKIAPIFTKGYAQQLKRTAIDHPGAIVGLIKVKEPVKLQLLREGLTTLAEEGGGAAEGHAAWQSVLNAWTHENLTKGGVNNLGKRLETLTPDFLEAMGPEGRQIVDNLRQVSTAYEKAVAEGRLKVGGAEAVASGAKSQARQEGAEALLQARRTGRETVAQAKQGTQAQVRSAAADVRTAHKAVAAGHRPTAEESRFLESSLAPNKTRDPAEIGSDIGRVAMLGAHSRYGWMSAMHLIQGPKTRDLLEWAKYSPLGTRLMVQVFSSPEPGAAMADLVRVVRTSLEQAHQKKQAPPNPQVGQPPPQP